MANCHVYYDELRFNVRDDNVVHAYVYMACDGDCPFFVAGWHAKSFPQMTTLDILMAIGSGEEDFLKWERIEQPPEPQPRSVGVSDYWPGKPE